MNFIFCTTYKLFSEISVYFHSNKEHKNLNCSKILKKLNFQIYLNLIKI